MLYLTATDVQLRMAEYRVWEAAALRHLAEDFARPILDHLYEVVVRELSLQETELQRWADDGGAVP